MSVLKSALGSYAYAHMMFQRHDGYLINHVYSNNYYIKQNATVKLSPFN